MDYDTAFDNLKRKIKRIYTIGMIIFGVFITVLLFFVKIGYLLLAIFVFTVVWIIIVSLYAKKELNKLKEVYLK